MKIGKIPFASAINAIVLLFPVLAEFSFGYYFWHTPLGCRWGIGCGRAEEARGWARKFLKI
jgi:hypothetical protein